MDNTNTADGSLNESRDSLAAYALDALDPNERAQVERLLAISEEARQELLELQEGAEALSYLAGELEPPTRLKDRILSLARSVQPVAGTLAALEPTASPETGWPARLSIRLKTARLGYFGTSVAAAGIVALAVFFGVQNSRLSSQVDDLNSQIAESRSTINGLQSTVAAASGTINEQNSQIDDLEGSLRDLRRTTYLVASGAVNVSKWLEGGQTAPEADGTRFSRNFSEISRSTSRAFGL